MYEKDILVRRRLRSQKIFGPGHVRLDQLARDTPVFFRRKNMLPNRQVVFVAVDELEGKHQY
jgi:hypothetical protein